MPLTADDIAQVAAIVAQTMAQLQETAGAAHGPKPQNVDERHFRKLATFGGDHWKDWAFQFKSAMRASSSKAYAMLLWAEQEQVEIEDFLNLEEIETEVEGEQISGQIFNIISTTVKGEALQLMHNCGYNGAEAWRRLSKRYSPSTPLRAMQLMLQAVNPGKCRSLKEVPSQLDRWESKVLALERDFKEKMSSKMKSAILISMLPSDLQNALIQQAEKYEEYVPTKEKILSIVEAKIAMKNPDDMDTSGVDQSSWTTQQWLDWDAGGDDEEAVDMVGKGGVQCYRCGGQGHMSKNCATPEPAKGKSKGNAKGAKGSSKGKAAGGKGRNGKNSKGEFVGFCSFCGKSGHKEAECWAKERRNSSAPLANVDAAAVDKELGGFDVAGLDFSLVPPAPKPHKTWADIVRKKGPFIFPTIVPQPTAEMHSSLLRATRKAIATASKTADDEKSFPGKPTFLKEKGP